MISIDGADPAASEISQRDTEAIARTRDCVEGCRIDEVCLLSATLLTASHSAHMPVPPIRGHVWTPTMQCLLPPCSVQSVCKALFQVLEQGMHLFSKQRVGYAAASVRDARRALWCSAAQIFADSKFLREEALLDLVRAVIWAAGGFQRVTASSDETDTEQARRFNT